MEAFAAAQDAASRSLAGCWYAFTVRAESAEASAKEFSFMYFVFLGTHVLHAHAPPPLLYACERELTRAVVGGLAFSTDGRWLATTAFCS